MFADGRELLTEPCTIWFQKDLLPNVIREKMAALISNSNRTDNDKNNNKGFVVRIALFVCVILPQLRPNC